MQSVFNRLRHGILGLVVAAALAAAGAEAARAAPLDDAFAAYGRKEYAAAMALARPLADAGDGWAAYLVGRMIDLGEGVIYDDVAALQWYLQAAAKGVPDGSACRRPPLRDGRKHPAGLSRRVGVGGRGRRPGPGRGGKIPRPHAAVPDRAGQRRGAREL